MPGGGGNVCGVSASPCVSAAWTVACSTWEGAFRRLGNSQIRSHMQSYTVSIRLIGEKQALKVDTGKSRRE